MEYGKKINSGGFVFLKYKKGDMSFIKVSTLMGNWSVEWREDSMMFHCLDSDLDEDTLNALRVVVTNAFMVSNFFDSEFQHAVLIASGELQERIIGESDLVSDEEDSEILNEVRTEYELREELDKEDKGC